MSSHLTDLAKSLLPETAYMQLVTVDTRGGGVRPTLLATQPADLFTAEIIDEEEAAAALSAVWLWHDALDASHVLCQSIETATGSLWHAILHRREGDFSNAKYWYARARAHPSLRSITPAVEALLTAAPAEAKVPRVIGPSGWNPAAFVDAVEAAHASPGDPKRATLIALQKLEWRAAFEATVRAALGR